MPTSINGQSFDNDQPYLVLTEVSPSTGIFPNNGGGGSANGDTLGFVYDFAGNFPPGVSYSLQGQLVSISQNTMVFSLLGTNFGGNGTTTFQLPNLAGQVIVGTGNIGPDVSPQSLGEQSGSSTASLGLNQIPSNTILPGGQSSGAGGQPFSNIQPSLGLERLICVSGVFPSSGGNSGSSTFIGQVATFEGNFVPPGWGLAQGQILSIAQNQALFAILGTTYGGNGTTTFALPNLSGRVSVGVDATHPLGTIFGQENTTVTSSGLPVPTGGGQAVPNDQPSIALNYLIATSGLYPTRDGGAGFDQSTPTLGQIVEFAGNFAPSGYVFANGQLLSINQNQALFSLLGTQYGGNGTTNFALPDLRGRTVVGAGTYNGQTYNVGDTGGSDTISLTAANLPQVTCFAEGTLIATARGPVPVEALREGDTVITASGALRPLVWVGWRRIDARRHPEPDAVRPVRIAAHAFGPGQPSRDLFLSPEHAVFAEGTLIPVSALVNGSSVVATSRDHVVYWHVELETHDVILAEGLPVESFLDHDTRQDFHGGTVTTLHPRFSGSEEGTAPYAPIMRQGAVVQSVRERLAQTAQSLEAAC